MNFNTTANELMRELLKIKPPVYDGRNHQESKSNLLNKVNQLRTEKLGLIKIKGQDCYILYNIDDKFYIDSNIYLSYRKRIKEVYFGSRYEINQYLKQYI